MFGHNWQKATGTVVGKVNSTRTRAGDFAVDVRMADGRLFRAQVEWPTIATNFREPSIGQVVGVEVDARDRVRFDKSDPALISRTSHSAQEAALRATLAEAPGTPPTPSSSMSEGLQAQVELREKIAATSKDIADMNDILRAKLAARGIDPGNPPTSHS